MTESAENGKVFEQELPSEDLLYHFTSLENGLEKIIPNRALRFAPLFGMNDPLEFEDIYHVGVGLDYGDEINKALLHGDLVKVIRRQALLACFCTEKFDSHDIATPFTKGWKRARMWAQYARNHRGVCLVFSKERLESAIRSALPERWISVPDYVKYREEYDLSRDIMESTTLHVGDAEKETAQERLVREASALLFSKFHDFRDEREWRMILVPNEQTAISDYFVPIQDSLLAVILGTKFPNVYETAIVDSARCDVFRVGWFHGRAELTKVAKRSSGQ